MSGGVDSVALLAALILLRRKSVRWAALPLRAVHVHHGLRPAADDWARHCRKLCREWGVPLVVRRVTVPQGRGRSLESDARTVRYAALGRGLRREEWLLTAHHVDDQLETQILKLMRGTGIAGLAAMPYITSFGKGALVRPLLDETRAALESFAQSQQLAWVEDDSNVDERFDRNYVRAKVVPVLRARWPSASLVAARSAAHLREARELLEALAATDFAAIGFEGHRVDIAKLAKLSPARQRNVLRYWLAREGLVLPDTVHLERIRRELPAARRDANPLVRWEGGEVRRFRGRLFIVRHDIESAANGVTRRPWDWRRARRFELDGGAGVLRLVADPHGSIDGARLPAPLWVGRRQGGDSLALRRGGPRRRLKELLRDSAVPPWLRDRLPIVFDGPEIDSARIVAIADLFVAAAYIAHGDTTPARGRFRLVWEGQIC